MEFNKFVKNRLAGLQLLTVSMDTYIPGAVLDKKTWMQIGHLKDILTDLPAKTWVLDQAEANIASEKIQGQKSMRSGVRILGVVSLNGGFSKNYTADYTITNIEGEVFKNTSQLKLMPSVNAIRRSDRSTWRLINGNLVITEAYYAKEFTVKFKKNGSVTGKAEMDQLLAGKKHGEVDYKWGSEETLVIANNMKVPFGVRGFIV